MHEQPFSQLSVFGNLTRQYCHYASLQRSSWLVMKAGAITIAEARRMFAVIDMW
uniref:Uncharacterized protein n=1 Tax=Rhizobium rhizogenes TaxID=359 RepID=A0A7S5DR66_RHIRH|nr:hypothetical protein pC6.5d_705 [Rhizobium rhizogenes]